LLFGDTGRQAIRRELACGIFLLGLDLTFFSRFHAANVRKHTVSPYSKPHRLTARAPPEGRAF